MWYKLNIQNLGEDRGFEEWSVKTRMFKNQRGEGGSNNSSCWDSKEEGVICAVKIDKIGPIKRQINPIKR